MNILILFSGTKSFSKVLEKNKNNIIRTLDIDNYFNPTYNIDILKWDYKNDLKDFKVDYLHSSPVCKSFTHLQNCNRFIKSKPTLKDGFILIDKTIEIIKWIQKEQNPKLKFTIENPKTKYTLNYEPLKNYKYCITSYCQYGYLYKKDTIFWYDGFNLILKERCNNKNICFSKSITNSNAHIVRIGLSKKNKNIKYLVNKNHKDQIGCNEHFNNIKNIHKIVLGYKPKNKDQIIGWKYFTYLKNNNEYKINKYKMSDTYFRYRIPKKLIIDIINQLEIIK